jgi:hypothetical protein
MWCDRWVAQRYVKRKGWTTRKGMGRINRVGSFGSAFQRKSMALPLMRNKKRA